MTCPNYLKKQDKPFCRAYSQQLSPEKEKECFNQYEKCLHEAERFIHREKEQKLEIEDLRKSKERRIERIPENLYFSISHPVSPHFKE